jgi:osmotically-inducible protein OsmY
MRHGLLRHSALLGLACATALTVYGCNRDYEADDTDAGTTNEYGDTTTPGTGTGTVTDPNLGMDAGADDSAIKDRVQAQLRNDPRFRDVDIDVDDGIVTIDGQVANQADLDQVTQLVRTVQGVRDVKLDVDVESSMEKDDNPNN